MSQTFEENIHKSVLAVETLEVLKPQNGENFIDATLGLGGHTEMILSSSADTKVVGIDRDLEAISLAKKRLETFGNRVEIVHNNFSEIKQVAETVKIDKINGIIADLGVSSLQFDSRTRGFSFRFDAPLDMRMNQGSDALTAAELLETLSEFDIARIIYEYGEERLSRRIARRIVEKRERGEPVKTTRELAELIERAIGRGKKDKIHPATRTFQALRIAVNEELEILEQFIRDSVEILEKGGRFAVISFHSLEDRIVKQTFQKLAGKCVCPPRLPQCACGARREIEILTRKPIVPGERELEENPRSRSAKLRAYIKL
jgi:16S rRNA (cytosine1402-N4)-methyltransferase